MMADDEGEREGARWPVLRSNKTIAIVLPEEVMVRRSDRTFYISYAVFLAGNSNCTAVAFQLA